MYAYRFACELINDFFLPIEVDVPVEKPEIPKVSLNPLPPERLIRSSEEREKSSEPGLEDSDSDAGSNGDIEDNLEDHSKPDLGIHIGNDAKSDILRNIKPFLPDPDRLDPHMEALCKKVRKFSVSFLKLDLSTRKSPKKLEKPEIACKDPKSSKSPKRPEIV